MARSTPATRALTEQGVSFTLRAYDYDPGDQRVGLQAAEALGEPAHRLLKTLIAQVDGRPVCLMVPSDREVSMKKVAAAFGGKSAKMASPADAERITGFKVGGVSPFGQKRRLPTAIDAAALGEPYVLVNAGQRGLQAQLSPEDARRASAAVATALVSDG
ncbi:MAG: Cys-tRNA(Pro) deacylase [Caulobacteraceae bacterium]